MTKHTLWLLFLAVALVATGCTPAQSESASQNASTDASSAAVEAEPEVASDTADEPAADSDLDGTVFGEGVSLTETIAISELYDNIEDYEGQRVRVEGLITDVCEKRGCWFEMASDREFEILRFKVEDGVITFPMEIRGQHAVAEGVARKIEYSLEETKEKMAHHAEEHGEPYDPDSVTEPMIEVRLDGIGAVVREAP